MAGKRGSLRHSTTSLSESSRECRSGGNKLSNVRSFSILHLERAEPPSITIRVLTFLVKKSTMKNSGVSIF